MTVGCCGALSACGGGGGGDSSDQPAKATQAVPVAPLSVATPAHTVKIAMYGDSTTYGTTFETGSYTQSPHNEPASIQSALQQKYGSAVTVENHGVPGSTCSELLYGTDPISRPWTTEMSQSDAQIVTFNPEINDAFIAGLSDQDFIFCQQQLAEIARQYGKTVVMMTGNPIDNAHNAQMWSLSNDARSVASKLGTPIVDQWTYIQANLPNWQSYLPDGVHPNDALYELKAKNSLSVIGPLVQSIIAG